MNYETYMVVVAQMDRASDCDSEGYEIVPRGSPNF